MLEWCLSFQNLEKIKIGYIYALVRIFYFCLSFLNCLSDFSQISLVMPYTVQIMGSLSKFRKFAFWQFFQPFLCSEYIRVAIY